MTIIEKIKYYFIIYWKIQMQNIKSIKQYRVDFLMMLFFTLVAQICNLSVIGIIYSNVPSVGGWTVWEILVLYGYLLFSEGSVNFFCQGAWKITQMLNKAEIDRFLVRPLPIGLQLITAKIDFDGLNKMFIASMIFYTSFSRCNIRWTIGKVFYLVISILLACIIRTCMIWIASCTSFWMEGAKNTLNFWVLTLGEIAKYPLVIYPTAFKTLFAYIIPYAFVCYIPTLYILDKYNGRGSILLIFSVCVGMIVLAHGILKAGLKRYESNGN